MAAASSRGFSPPPTSYGAPSTTGTVQSNPLSARIVQQLVIEGRCDSTQEGASLRLFMKLSLPFESLSPLASIPLFPEENVRIVDSKVHPLDSKSAPYAFSTTASPLLHSTARALNLPPRSNKSYYTFLGVPPSVDSPGSSGDPSSSRRAAAVAPLPLNLTGAITVSNFHICFILPRVLPTRGAVLADTDFDPLSRSSTRSAFGDNTGKQISFMAGVDIFVPYASRPPKSPYLLSLPLPRCLRNFIKLKIVPAPTLPSGQDAPRWEVLSDPNVTYGPSRGSRSTSYERLADDEASIDGSLEPGALVAVPAGLQGSFPSADRIRVRWAHPMGHNPMPDGRRRVGIEEVAGLLYCKLLGRDDRGWTRMRLQYEGVCRGLWYQGVATQLGMDIMLNGKGRSLAWASEGEQWELSGDANLVGFVGGKDSKGQTTTLPEDDSMDRSIRGSLSQSRLSSYGAPSLLQATLPNISTLPDYSFETTPSPTVSMINSAGTPYSAASSVVTLSNPLNQPVTLFLTIANMDPAPNNEFTFKLSGTILVGPLREGEQDDEDEPLELPAFNVLPAEGSFNEVIISSQLQESVEVILASEKRQQRSGLPNGLRTPPPKRKVLRRGQNLRADDGASVVFIANPESPKEPPVSHYWATPRSPRTPRASDASRLTRSPRTPITPRVGLIASPMLGGAYPIPWVKTEVTLLPDSVQHSHVVRFSVPSVAATDCVLAFGVCLPPTLVRDDETAIEIVSATADGINLPWEVISRDLLEDDGEQLGIPDLTRTPRKEDMEDTALGNIDRWIRVVLPDERILGNIEIHYLVAREPQAKGKEKKRLDGQISILLPAFHVGVGTYTVDVRTPRGYKEPLLLANFTQQDDGQLSHYRLPGYFYPRVRAQVEKLSTDTGPSFSMRSLQTTGWVLGRVWNMIPVIASLAALWIVIAIRNDLYNSQLIKNAPLGSNWASQPRTPPGEYPPQAGQTPDSEPTFPYTVDTATATQYQTPGANSDITLFKQVHALIPLQLGLLQRLDWARLADALLISMEKLVGFLQTVINFPAPP